MLGITNDLCPVCYWAERNVREHLMLRLHSWETDPAAQQDLVERGGLCGIHTAALLSIGSPQAISTILPILAAATETAIGGWNEHGEGNGERSQDGLSTIYTVTVHCVLCEIKAHTERDRIAAVRSGVQRESFRAEYEASAGLCLPHLSALMQVMDLPEELTARTFLLRCTCLQFQRLSEEARQFRKKHQERRRAEMTPAELRAWFVGMEKLAGHSEAIRLG